MIQELSRRSDVDAIYLTETEAQPALDTAVPTSLAPAVWAQGYNGTGMTIAIIEHGNVDTTNTFLHHASIRRDANNGPQDHTTLVASTAASFTDTYRGTAYGATILSVGGNGLESDMAAALQWESDHGAYVINLSEGFQTDNNMNYTDLVFDYWARARFLTIAAAAGNSGGSLISPAKAWNVISTGNSDDQNTTGWSDDSMWGTSSYINPASANGDREKPEIVAVGTNVTGLAGGNVLWVGTGTSLASPQVAGLAALLNERNSSLQYYPVATKAIIMASATHNIEGPTTIVEGQGDLRDGAGAINTAFADSIAQLRVDFNTTCYSSYRRGDYIYQANFPLGTDLESPFYAEQGDLIRVAIAWWANADSGYYSDGLATDLDLRVKSPDSQYIPGVNSVSYDNNYEMVEFVASQTGVYKIAMRKLRADETGNYLGIAFLRLHQIYLPLVLKEQQ